MTTKEWAARLNGIEYPAHEVESWQAEAAKDGVVIVYGMSDDLIEFAGAINEEDGAWDGTEVKITPDGKLYNEDENREVLKYNSMQVSNMPKVRAIWSPRGADGEIWASWEIQTRITHETFDIMEDGEVFCRGVVFTLALALVA
ncbi:MAG: hypothetical protein ACOYM2_21160 [Rectinemataceae bacterium]